MFKSCGWALLAATTNGEYEMTWKAPTVTEIALGAEINAYASAAASK